MVRTVPVGTEASSWPRGVVTCMTSLRRTVGGGGCLVFGGGPGLATVLYLYLLGVTLPTIGEISEYPRLWLPEGWWFLVDPCLPNSVREASIMIVVQQWRKQLSTWPQVMETTAIENVDFGAYATLQLPRGTPPGIHWQETRKGVQKKKVPCVDLFALD